MGKSKGQTGTLTRIRPPPPSASCLLLEPGEAGGNDPGERLGQQKGQWACASFLWLVGGCLQVEEAAKEKRETKVEKP